MSESEEFDFESLVAAALQLTPERRQQFLLLLPSEMRVAIVRRLEETAENQDKTLVDQIGDRDMLDAATQILEPDPAVNPGSKTISDFVPDDEHDDIDNLDAISPKTVITDTGVGNSRTIVDGGADSRPVKGGDFTGSGGDSKHGSGVYLVKLHARGAIGEVFVAYDEKLSREVAIKRIRPELSPNERRVRRFLREAVITAKLQHPGIVPIYTMSHTGGSPHYTMPLVSGLTMAKLISQTHEKLGRSTSPQKWISAMRPLLRHFIAVCNAIDYAHTENVVHRDLKPSNIIIGSRGETMVLDWGCAKNIGDSGTVDDEDLLDEDNPLQLSDSQYGRKGGNDITIAGSVMGTVEYMSPEQAAGDTESVGKPSDIFGLGATLFSLLTNQRTIDYDSEDEVRVALLKVRKGEFRPIDDLDPRVPPAIGAICQRAMAFKPGDRYPTAGELGREVEAFLNGDVVDAYPEPWHERMKRFVLRHQTLFATLAGVLFVGFLSLIAANVLVNQQKGKLESLNQQLTKSVNTERDLRGHANRNEELVTQQLYGNQMLLASEASTEAGGLGRLRELVSKWSGEDFEFLRGWEWAHLNSLGNRELWTLKANLTASQILTTRDQPFVKVFDRQKSEILSVDLVQREEIGREKVDSDCLVVDFNRDQTRLAMGHQDGRVSIRTSVSDGETEMAQYREHDAKVFDVKWNIGGDLLASCDVDGKIVIWNVRDQKVVGRGEGVLPQPGKSVLVWSYDGKQMYWTTGQSLQRLDVATQKQESIIEDGWIVSPCVSHEGDLLAYVGPENTIVVADSEGEILKRFEGHELFIESLKWHPKRHLLLSSSDDGSVRVWDADSLKEVRQLLGHEGHVYAAAWNPEGTLVISGGLPEDDLRIWDVGSVGKEAFDRELQNYPAFAWHSSGEQLVVAEGVDLMIQNSTGDTRWIRQKDKGSPIIRCVDFHPSEDIIACSSANGKVWTVDGNTGAQQVLFDAGADEDLLSAVSSRGVQWSPDGNFLAGVGSSGDLQVWNAADGELVFEVTGADRMLAVAWSPTSESGEAQIAAVGVGSEIIICDVQTQKVVRRIVQYGWKTGLAWSPDGKTLAVSHHRNVNVWNVVDGSFVQSCDGPSAMVWDVDWSASENRFAALTEDGKVCVWNDQTWDFVAKFALHPRAPYCLRWSPDGTRLASTARHGRIVFQDVD